MYDSLLYKEMNLNPKSTRVRVRGKSSKYPDQTNLSRQGKELYHDFQLKKKADSHGSHIKYLDVIVLDRCTILF